MLHWQLIGLFMLFITAMCINWPTDEETFKTCLHFTGDDNGDEKCAQSCKAKGKPGGSCKMKRCVCSNVKANEDDNKESKSKSRRLSIFKDQLSTMDLSLCRLYCKNLEKFNEVRLHEICDCSRL